MMDRRTFLKGVAAASAVLASNHSIFSLPSKEDSYVLKYSAVTITDAQLEENENFKDYVKERMLQAFDSFDNSFHRMSPVKFETERRIKHCDWVVVGRAWCKV